MKKLFIVANWKSHKTTSSAVEWLSFFKDRPIPEGKEIILCVPFTLLSVCAFFIHEHNLSFEVGSQDISLFEEGSFTGEINAGQIKEFADYVLLGHSEREKYFGETRDMVEKKAKQAQIVSLQTILCVPNAETAIPENTPIIAYEPPSAIGSGLPDTSDNAELVAIKIKNNQGVQVVLYGGSVTSENVASFTQSSHIDGVLVGKASLDPEEFLRIIEHA